MIPKFSFIIPVFHGGKFLKDALTSLANVVSPNGGYEIIITGEKQAVSDLSFIELNQDKWRKV